MGLDPVTLGYIAAATTVASAYAQNEQQRQAAGEQKDARKEQQAMNAAQAAQERRQQIREERIRRARILQSSANTGVSASSGEVGAVGGMATQLQSNVGFNLGMQRSANAISNFQQNTQDAMDQAAMWGQLGQLSGSIFNATGGFGAKGAGGTQQPAPVVDRSFT